MTDDEALIVQLKIEKITKSNSLQACMHACPPSIHAAAVYTCLNTYIYSYSACIVDNVNVEYSQLISLGCHGKLAAIHCKMQEHAMILAEHACMHVILIGDE